MMTLRSAACVGSLVVGIASACGGSGTSSQETRGDASVPDAAASGSSSSSSGGSSSSGSSGSSSGSPDAASDCPTQATTSVAQPMPVISRGAPAFASSAQNASPANDGASSDYDVFWESSTQPISSAAPAWLAYDLSGVPACQRKKVLVSWYQPVAYDAFDPYDFTISTSYVDAINHTGNGKYGLPMTYTLEGNAAAGGSSSPPPNGWVALLPSDVTNNVYHGRAHLIDFTGYNWIRMRVTAVTASASAAGKPSLASNQDVAVKLDVQDASLGVADSWLFLGDSITSHCMSNIDGGNSGANKSFPELVHASLPAFFPAAINGGMGGSKTITNPTPAKAGDASASIDLWLALFPGKFVGLSWGTNDCGGNPWGIDPSIAAYKTLINKVIAAGKVPVVPHVPWAPNTGISGATDPSTGAPYAPLSPGAAYNAQIDSQLYTIAGVVRGPDLWAAFKGKTSLFLDATNVHPNDDGIAVYRQAWATAMLGTVYPH
jgi:hypothetical protein